LEAAGAEAVALASGSCLVLRPWVAVVVSVSVLVVVGYTMIGSAVH
jgi:glycerol-3-phosphate acyltransferase PlsY